MVCSFVHNLYISGRHNFDDNSNDLWQIVFFKDGSNNRSYPSGSPRTLPLSHQEESESSSLESGCASNWLVSRECVTMEFYAAERKKELIPFATAWMELESIMLSEIRQVVRDKYHMISPLTGT